MISTPLGLEKKSEGTPWDAYESSFDSPFDFAQGADYCLG
jgi:hypothetical protein